MTPDPYIVIVPLDRQKMAIVEDPYLSDIADEINAMQTEAGTATGRRGRAKRWVGRTPNLPLDDALSGPDKPA